MYQHFTHFLVTVLIVLPQLCQAQGNTRVTNYYTIKQGLPNNYVLHIQQDSKGFLWIGTTNGLSRFNGISFKNYGIKQGLHNLFTNYIYEDSRQNLWVATSNCVYVLRNDSLVSFPFLLGQDIKYIYSIKELNDNEIWAFTNAGSFVFSKGYWQKKDIIPLIKHNECRDVIELADGTKVINCSSEIFVQNKNGTVKKIGNSEKKGVYFLQIFKHENKFYTSTINGLFEFDFNGFFLKVINSKEYNHSPSISFIDSRKRLWQYEIGTLNLFVFDLASPLQSPHKIPITISLTSGFYEDENRNIWIASGEGLLQIPDNNQTTISSIKHSTLKNLRKIVSLGENSILVSDEIRGLCKVQITDTIHVQKCIYKSTDFIDESIKAGNHYYFTTRKGKLLRFANNTITVLNNSKDGFTRFCNRISHNPATGLLFICSDSLYTIRPTETEKFIPRVRNTQIPHPRSVTCFMNGNSIVRTDDGHYLQLNPNNRITDVTAVLQLNSIKANTFFYEENESTFWTYSTGRGIDCFQWKNGLPQFQYNINASNGLQSDMIYKMQIDKEKKIWLLNTKGIFLLPKNKEGNYSDIYSFENFFNLRIEKPEFADMIIDTAQNLWISDYNVIHSINTKQIRFSTLAPRVIIEDIKLIDENSNIRYYTNKFQNYNKVPDSFFLPYNKNSLQFIFEGSNLTNRDELQFSYVLSKDQNPGSWSSPSNSKQIIVADILPGNYLLQVRAKTANSDWSVPVSVNFTILRPFWETWWFRGITLLLTSFLLTLIIRRRIKTIQHKAEAQSQLYALEMKAFKAQMNPHFIYNALNSIQALAATGKQPEIIEYIGKFSRLLRQILEQSDQTTIQLSKELQFLQYYISLESLRLGLTPDIKIQIAENVLPTELPIPPLILQPFIENSLWHGLSEKVGDSIINIHITRSNEWLKCTITDNGIGRTAASLKPQKHNKSKGLEITYSRLKIYNKTTHPKPFEITDLYDANNNASGTRVDVLIRIFQ